jgi:hypothetical protein
MEEIARTPEAEITRAARLAREADKAAGKRHATSRNHHGGSGDSDEEPGDGAASEGHHPKFNWRRPPGRDQSTLQEELGQIE